MIHDANGVMDAQYETSMTELAISIVNHNSVGPLQACLETIYATLKDRSYEIHVVDNLCEEPAADMLAAEHPKVNVLTNSQTLGFGANHNQVLQSVIHRSTYVLVLNPDTVLSPGSIQRMIEFLHRNQSVAVCSPTLVGSHGTWDFLPKQAVKLHRDALLLALYISNAKMLRKWLERLRGRESSKKGITPANGSNVEESAISPFDSESREVILGACMLFRTEALRDVGLFDERFFLYFEEYDWCLRARRRGWDVSLLHGVEVTHVRGYSTTRRDFIRYFSILVQSWLKFYGKHGGVWSERMLRTWLSTVAIFNIVRWSILYPLLPSKRGGLAIWRTFSVDLLKKIWGFEN